MFDAGIDPAGLTDDELSALLRQASIEVDRAEARRLVVAAEWDRRQAWAADGAYNGRCWMAQECTVSRREAYGILRTARVVASAPVVAAAVADGSLPVAKTEVLASVVTSRTADAFVRDQQVLVDAIGHLGVDETRKVAQWWQRLADQDGAEPEVREPQVRVGIASNGTTHLAGVLDVEGGAIFRSVLGQLTDQLWRAERADVDRHADQKDPPPYMGGRLRAAALIEMARLAAGADPNRSGTRPLITVVVDLPTLEGRSGAPAVVDDSGIVTAEAARRLACDAQIARVLTGPDGALLELGRTARTATADQWRALRFRDGGCTWPGCDRPPGWCQAHHIIWWEHDGRTDLDNLTLLCSHHHHRIHDGGWQLERLDDGGLRFTSPGGRILSRPPPLPPLPLPPRRPIVSRLDRAAIRARLRVLTQTDAA